MTDVLRQLTALSLCCGAALTLCPAGQVKQILQILSSVLICLLLLSMLQDFDYSVHALEQAKLSQAAAELTDESREIGDRLNRRFVEQSYRNYVLDRAQAFGLDDISAEVRTQWSLDGLWVPNEVTIAGQWSEEEAIRLQNVLEQELGIPPERQEWLYDG